MSRTRSSAQPRDELTGQLPGRTLVTLTSVSDDDIGQELTVPPDIEPGREVLPETRLQAVALTGWDDPQTLGALLTRCAGERWPARTTTRNGGDRRLLGAA